MAKVKLPRTLARIPQSCVILASSLGNVDFRSLLIDKLQNAFIPSTAAKDIATILLANIELSYLGFLQDFSIIQTRTVKSVYKLGEYEPSVNIPQNVTYTGKAKRVWVYEPNTRPSPKTAATFEQNLGFAPGIKNQLAPFIIVQRLYSPPVKPTTDDWDWDVENMLIYLDCWFTKIDWKWDYTGSDKFYTTEDVDFTIGKMLTLNSFPKGGGRLNVHKITEK